ncbi:hypothetical protein AAVH_28972 [Aphelenchoides avenae]|nr:hypothetical protein AAVH_28972 [Aphelenchus avenae]
MDSQESSPAPVPWWEGYFKLVQVGDVKAIFDAHGKLYYAPESQRLRLFDSNGNLRLTVPMHRVRLPKSRKLPRGSQYSILLTHQARAGTDADCELHFKSPDEAARRNLHNFILAEREIEHPNKSGNDKSADAGGAENAPAQRPPQHEQLASVAKVESGQGTLKLSNGSTSNVKLEDVAESPRASSPMDIEDPVEQLRQQNAELESLRRQAEEEISRLKQEILKTDIHF